MKGASHIDYKALYQQRLHHDKQQQKRIASLQDDITRTIQQQQRLGQAISGMQKTLIEKEEVIEAQKNIVEAHLQTIHSQVFKNGAAGATHHFTGPVGFEATKRVGTKQKRSLASGHSEA